MKEIDLSKYAPRTDLADEIVTSSKDTKEYSVTNKKYHDVNISYITIHKDNNSFNKKKGDYISIEFSNVEDQKNRDIIKEVFERSQVINNSSVDTVLNSSLGFLELIDKTNKTVFKIDTPIKNTGYSQSSLFIVAVVFMLVLIGNIAVIIRFKLYRKDYE